MASRLSIFHPPGVPRLPANPFGKDIANLELYQALARYGGFERIDVLSQSTPDENETREALLGPQDGATKVFTGAILNQPLAAHAGALLRGQPDLYELGWLRRRTVGDRAYSLLGQVHTIAPPAVRQIIAMASVGPLHPWDAILCTSPSVRDALQTMFAEWGEHLAERTAGKPPERPLLPIVPLGVESGRFAALADRPDARKRRREALGVGDADILALWVGRLSFFEKAFPQPMFQALQRAAVATGVKVNFVMAGWFPGEDDRTRYEQAARLHAPDVNASFPDGNDRELLGELWAAADIFVSLVDNIQETFGITPLEAMAAGLPVVVSDWDGYRSTVRHGIEGFLVPTLGGPPGGLGHTMSLRHLFEIDSYQAYVGVVAAHTAVNIGRAAEALEALIRSPDLRATMGAAGRARVRTAFDWPVVAGLHQGVLDELALVREASADPVARHSVPPVKGDPFTDFAGFATQVLTPDLPLLARPGATGADVLALTGDLDRAFGYWRAEAETCARAFDLLASGQARTGRDVLSAFEVGERRGVELGLMWLAKQGLIDWPA